MSPETNEPTLDIAITDSKTKPVDTMESKIAPSIATPDPVSKKKPRDDEDNEAKNEGEPEPKKRKIDPALTTSDGKHTNAYAGLVDDAMNRVADLDLHKGVQGLVTNPKKAVQDMGLTLKNVAENSCNGVKNTIGQTAQNYVDAGKAVVGGLSQVPNTLKCTINSVSQVASGVLKATEKQKTPPAPAPTNNVPNKTR